MREPLTRALTRAVRVVTGHVEEVLRPDGLTVDQWLVLAALAEERGLTMTELTARTPASGPTVTRVVDKLVGTALAYREVDPEDRRRVRVYLSPRGRALHKRLAGKVADVERRLLGHAEPDVLDFLLRLAET
ncbi:MarR family winged helix-turn-helix transcriptional regulator [Saccharothrix obliqua]|uniref:MarR family winged helix-turn-helix transcriptional regulator n=1 Tax=Saccharothrix obliqua TaxID=2861747 RepID=UPI001C5DE389|nr:MarR family transcriptional regulator [Saccharothrix obliqua]MBW4720517.1 MarR family transcriptional regulator [Saccharothrix obliqua]